MIEKLLMNGEGEQLDFKQTVTNLFKIAKTIVSFANTKGGKIVVGVRDDKSVEGIDPDEEKYMLNQAAEFYCKPPIQLKFRELELEDLEKYVLIVQVKESSDKPHYSRTKDDNWKAYVRVKDQSIPAGKRMEKTLSVQHHLHARQDLTKEERSLLLFLDKHDRITLKQLMQLKNYSKRRALRLLTLLTTKGRIRIHEHEKEAFYTL